MIVVMKKMKKEEEVFETKGFEEITFRNSNGLTLAGSYYPGNGNRLRKGVILCHGFASSKDRQHYEILCEKLQVLGFSVLRFDFGGCGKSDSRDILVSKQIDDLSCASSFMQSKGCTQLGLLGNSMGGITVLRFFEESLVKSIVLWAPVTSARDESWMKRKKLEWKKHKEDYIFVGRNEKKYLITNAFFEERMNVEQSSVCSKVTCPVLIVHGDCDTTTNCIESQKAMKYFSSDSKLEILPGAEHSFKGEDRAKAIDLAVKWFDKWMR